MTKRLPEKEPTASPDSEIRLNRFLAQCGLGARRKCDELIGSGHVFVNGAKVTGLGTKVRPGKDRIEYKGAALKALNTLEYIAYNKPRGVMVTREDPEGRATIYETLLRAGFDAGHLNYVGRLDFNSEGLLLLTNDGSLIHALTHPRFHIKKTYQVRTGRALGEPDRKALIDGVESESQVLHAGAVRNIASPEGKDEQLWYEIDLYEGKNRQIRRMFEGIKCDVRRLKRVQFSSVKIGALRHGEYRHLTPRELSGLRNSGFKNE